MGRKNKKSKLALTILSLVLLFVAVTFSFSNILAANRQNMGGSFTVFYRAKDVDATVSATYFPKSGDSVTLTTASSATSLALNRSGETGTLSASSESTLLTPSCNWAVFEYTIVNNSSVVPINLEVTDSSSTTNVTVKYGFKASGSRAETSQARYEAATIPKASLTTGDNNKYSLPVSGTVYFYILVEVTSIGEASASYSSTASSGLRWSLTSNVS